MNDPTLDTVIITQRDDVVVIGEATGSLYPGPAQGPAGPKGDAGPAGGAGPPGESYRVVDTPPSPYACVDRDEVWWTTSAAPVTQVLPANPSPGTRVRAIRSGGNTVTVVANGNTIRGISADLVLDEDGAGVELIWDATLVTWLVALFVACESGLVSSSWGARPGQTGGGSVPIYNAGVTLSGHVPLMFAPDQSVVPANPNGEGYVFAGVSLNAAQSGAGVMVRDDGLVVEPSWSWIAGLPIFASAAGSLTQAAPASGVLHLIGFAINATTLCVAPQPPVKVI